MPQPARPTRRRLPQAGRPASDGGIYQRRGRRPTPVQPTVRCTEARNHPPEMDGRGGDQHDRRPAATPAREAASWMSWNRSTGSATDSRRPGSRGNGRESMTTSARSRRRTARPCCFDLLAAEVDARHRCGERPSVEEYAAITPSWTTKSGEWFPSLVVSRGQPVPGSFAGFNDDRSAAALVPPPRSSATT